MTGANISVGFAVSISSKLGTGRFGRAMGSGVNLASVGGTLFAAGGGTGTDIAADGGDTDFAPGGG